MRVEILSLSLRPEGRVARDSSVASLFVEYSLLDLPTVETPLSLPKPLEGRNINYNYSKGEAASCLLPWRRPGTWTHRWSFVQLFLWTLKRTAAGGGC